MATVDRGARSARSLACDFPLRVRPPHRHLNHHQNHTRPLEELPRFGRRRALNLVVSSIVRMQPVEERLHAGVSRQALIASMVVALGTSASSTFLPRAGLPGCPGALTRPALAVRATRAWAAAWNSFFNGVIVPRRRRRSQRPPSRSSPDGFAHRRRLNSPQRSGGPVRPRPPPPVCCAAASSGGWTVSGWTASIEVPAGWLAGGGPPRRRAESGRGNGRSGSCRPSFVVAFEHRLAHRAQVGARLELIRSSRSGTPWRGIVRSSAPTFRKRS